LHGLSDKCVGMELLEVAPGVRLNALTNRLQNQTNVKGYM